MKKPARSRENKAMKKKKGEVFYKPIEGSSPLSIYWYDVPKGDAIEARSGIGVGFFSLGGELLGVIFDDVKEKNDHQTLSWPNGVKVEVLTKKGKVSFSVHDNGHRNKTA
jgi:hypothetical protein